MPNLDPWLNQNEDMTTKTINKFENHLLSVRVNAKKWFILTHTLPIKNIRWNYKNDRFGFGIISSRNKYKNDETAEWRIKSNNNRRYY
jgi:hypothetical protein